MDRLAKGGKLTDDERNRIMQHACMSLDEWRNRQKGEMPTGAAIPNGSKLNGPENDKGILSAEDFASVSSLLASYEKYQALGDAAAMDAIQRKLAAIRQKPEYEGKYLRTDQYGDFLDSYQYSSSSITKIAKVYIDGYEKLNAYQQVANVATFMLGFTPASPIVGVMALGSNRHIGMSDVVLEALGNVPNQYVARSAGVASFVSGLFSNTYESGDFEVQVQLTYNQGKTVDILRYYKPEESGIRKESDMTVDIPTTRGGVEWLYD
jgi:hypothetical protein